MKPQHWPGPLLYASVQLGVKPREAQHEEQLEITNEGKQNKRKTDKEKQSREEGETRGEAAIEG